MKVITKIGIGALMLVIVLAFATSFVYRGYDMVRKGTHTKAELPIEDEPPSQDSGEEDLSDDELASQDTEYELPRTPATSNSQGLSAVDRLLQEMASASIAFNAPEHLNIGDTPQIQLILSLGETVEELKRAINQAGRRIGATVKVSDRMQAHLAGQMFDITPIGPEVQAVSKSRRTEWQWQIRPKKAGKHSLHLTLTALLEVDGRSTPRAIKTFDRVIEVEVTATQRIRGFLMSNWQWLWAAVLVPIAGWLLKRGKKISEK